MTTEPVSSRPSLEAYGIPTEGPGPLSWDDTAAKVRESRNYWICSTRPDGRPHAVPVWGAWVDGALYFGTEASAVKAKNFAQNPAVVVHLESGDDCVILEGEVAVVDGQRPFDAQNAEFERKYNMALSDAGGGGGVLYEMRPTKALAWLETDFVNTATRWRWG